MEEPSQTIGERAIAMLAKQPTCKHDGTRHIYWFLGKTEPVILCSDCGLRLDEDPEPYIQQFRDAYGVTPIVGS